MNITVTDGAECKVTYEGLKEEVRLLREELGCSEGGIGYRQIQLVLGYYLEGILKNTDRSSCPECESGDVAFVEIPMTVQNQLSHLLCRNLFCQECGFFRSEMKDISEER